MERQLCDNPETHYGSLERKRLSSHGHPLYSMDEYPTNRPMGKFSNADTGISRPFTPMDAVQPWIDPHGHHHTITWRQHEEFDISGCVAVIMAGGLANESPYRPMHADDVRGGWDRVIRMSHILARTHAFDAYASIGIHTSLGPVEGIETLFDVFPEYAALPEVVSISETGISMVQEYERVPIETQRDIVRRQLGIADEFGLPAVLHTPTLSKGIDEYAEKSTEAHDSGGRILEPQTAKVDAAKIDVELANEAGLPEDRLAFTHANQTLAEWVLEHTDCYVSFTVGNVTRNISAHDIAPVVEEYGGDRVMIDSDSAGHKGLEPFAVKRTMLDLLRRGIDPEIVRQITYGNQRSLFDLDALPA